MVKKIISENLSAKVSRNDLIVFSIRSIKEKGKKCSFEKLVEECFVLFPKAFYLDNLAQWPDSRKLDRPLRDLREKKIISGSPEQGFNLTKSGEKIAKAIAENFRQRQLKI
jgi:hypothetical protein